MVGATRLGTGRGGCGRGDVVRVFGAIWLTFAGFGGSDAYRQTFVDEAASELTIVSVHTDDPDEAAAARKRLAGDPELTILSVDRLGQVVDEAAAELEHAVGSPEHRLGDVPHTHAAGSQPAIGAASGRGRAARGRLPPGRSPPPAGSCRGTDRCRRAHPPTSRRSANSAGGQLGSRCRGRSRQRSKPLRRTRRCGGRSASSPTHRTRWRCTPGSRRRSL